MKALLAPTSVAVIGASDDPTKIGGRPLDYLRRFGFAGEVFPINPRRERVQGLPSFPDVLSVGKNLDVAVIVVPGEDAVREVEQCAAAGVGAAVVLASGFAETGANGRRAQERMTAVARDAGMRLLGPNCQGVTNFSNGAVLTFSSMFLEVAPGDGPVAVVSQSGSMSQVPYALLRARGLGVRYVAATGNEADVTACELAAAMAEDPDVGLLLLYLETVRDASWLTELGRAASVRGLPVVALKAGATVAGQTAAVSHTGALANEDRVVDAFFERVGIYRARDLQDLVAAAELHLRRDWEPRGRGVSVVSNSGASCVQAADAIVAHGLEVAELAPSTVEQVAAVLPGFASPRNPVDLTAALLTNSGLLSQVLPLVRGDPATDALLLALPVAGESYDVARFAVDAASVAGSGCPTVVVAAYPPVAEAFRAEGLPVFLSEVEAVAALAQWYETRARRFGAVAPGSPRPASVPETLDEAASLAVLAAAGVPVVDHVLCADLESALGALSTLGAPVALKGCTPRVTHKTEAGLVALGVRSELDLRHAYERVAWALYRADPAAPGVIVARMARGLRELMIGARIDPVFGPVVLVGAGGAYVEVLPDVAVLLPPFGRDDVRRALGRLRMAPLLGPVRGEPEADVGAFADAAVAVSRLLSSDESVVEVDVNPVLVGAQGDGCVAVDALVRRRSGLEAGGGVAG